MPMHDWTRVDAGIFHAFHHDWITELARALNRGLLPSEYYALAEQQAAGFGPAILTLQAPDSDERDPPRAGGILTRTRPATRFVAQVPDAEFYRRKKSSIAIRHVSGDRFVALLEIMSLGNKSSRKAFPDFLEKAFEFLDSQIHLLIVDPYPPGRRDPNGIHGAIWEELQDEPFHLPADKRLTLVAYEAGMMTRAYIEPIAVGDSLPDMPLFVEPDNHVLVPLETTYQASFSNIPQRWRKVLE
ncbi:MAG: DUF4058 family protein [Planctomycetes bacterium]|jgi:hypothetical protein|nr:DUF4058 family protein [Planctomycetota bacterium]